MAKKEVCIRSPLFSPLPILLSSECYPSYIPFLQEKRLQLFNDYMDHGEDFAQVEAVFKSRLEESQKTSVKYGFRNDQWLIKHHGQKKADRIMQRKKSLGLNLDLKIKTLFILFDHYCSLAQPLVPCLIQSLQSFSGHLTPAKDDE